VRISESVDEARALRAEVRNWVIQWDSVDSIGLHLTQLDLLRQVAIGLVEQIEAQMLAIDPAIGLGMVYEECRLADLRLLHARRMWRWYADKFDQRLGPEGDDTVRTLLAADEVVWSCWKTAFGALGEPVPPAPVPYLAPQLSASATARAEPPDGLRPGADELLRKHVAELPLAVVRLPPVCVRRPWWLILSAHEVGHHVQFEAAGLQALTQERVVAAAFEVSADLMMAEAWRPWGRELFADACSVLLAGPAASWAVAELEQRTGPGLRTSPSFGYPPPLVRLAVLRAVAEQARLPFWPGLLHDEGGQRPGGPEAADDLAALLDCVPAVAAALLGLTSACGRPLSSLADATALACRPDGAVDGWQAELLGADEPVARATLDSARFCAAAGVQAWYRLAAQDGQADLAARLSGRLRQVLPLCRAPGTRAGGTAPDAAAIVRAFAADLTEGIRE
jgi:hypothetical protein